MTIENAYLKALKDVMTYGHDGEDRTGTGTRSLFGVSMRFDLSEGFPAVTTKRLAFKTMATELMWFIAGSQDLALLQSHGCKIWNEWKRNAPGAAAYDLGPIYGKQWRNWQTNPGCGGGYYCDEFSPDFDQLADLVENLKNNPHSRRHILSAWNVGELPDMALPPCHMMSQFYVRDGELSCMMIQRSGDMFLGVPFNIASYALLTHILAHLTGYRVGELVHHIGDAHVYSNHFDQVETQLSRKPFKPPTLRFGEPAQSAEEINDFMLRPDTDVGAFFQLVDYEHHPTIKAPVAV